MVGRNHSKYHGGGICCNILNRRHLHLSETGRQIHLPRKKRLINRKRHRHTANEGMDSSDLTDKMKCSFFQAAVISTLLYGCTTWTLTKRLEKKLDGNYTRMLQAMLNKSWRQHPTKHRLYGHLTPITKIIQVRLTRHARHSWRSRDELISDVLLWTPTYGRANVGRPARTNIQQLCEDTGCSHEDLPEAMNATREGQGYPCLRHDTMMEYSTIVVFYVGMRFELDYNNIYI